MVYLEREGQYLSDKAVVERELGTLRAQFTRLEARGREQAGIASSSGGRDAEERSFQRAKKFVEDECVKLRRTIDIITEKLLERHKILEKECNGSRDELKRFDGTLRTLAEIMARIKSGNNLSHGRIEGMCRALQENDVELANKIKSLNSELEGLREGIAGSSGISSSALSGAIDLTGDSRGERLLRQLREVESKVSKQEVANSRSSDHTRDAISELRGDANDLKNQMRTMRESGRPSSRARSARSDAGHLKVNLDGIRNSIDEVSSIAGRAREEARRVSERVDAVVTANEDLKAVSEDQRSRIAKLEQENDGRRAEIRKLETASSTLSSGTKRDLER